MPANLREILYATRKAVEARRDGADLDALRSRAEEHVPRGFRRALDRVAQGGVAVIAELKRASPSQGALRSTFPVAGMAAELEQAGAVALSVLTDAPYFQGSPADLFEASSATQLPCLCKDFVLDEFQILEAKANGADAVLLIVAALPRENLQALAERAWELGLDVLCEIHDPRELQVALGAGCDLVGVNSRDLETFTVNLETAIRLGPSIPGNIFRVAESGIRSGADIRRLRDAGYKAFLVGETLMRADSPGEALRTLLAESKG